MLRHQKEKKKETYSYTVGNPSLGTYTQKQLIASVWTHRHLFFQLTARLALTGKQMQKKHSKFLVAGKTKI